MRALVVVDAQNEFSPDGLMPVLGHADAVAAIARFTVIGCHRLVK